jgi:serine/threonine protein kinase
MWCARVSFSFLNHTQAPTPHSRTYHPSTNDHHHHQNEQGQVIELFIVQDLCKGGTLREVVQDQMITVGRQLYSLRTAVSWALDVAKALCYLHRCKPPVVHRDLKLENVILSTPFKKSGVVWRGDEPADSHPPAKLADFGLATFVDHGMKNKRLLKQTKTSKEGNPLGENSSKVVRLLERMQTLSSFGGSDETGDKSEHARSANGDDDGNDVTGVAGSFGYMAPEVGIESDVCRVQSARPESLAYSLARSRFALRSLARCSTTRWVLEERNSPAAPASTRALTHSRHSIRSFASTTTRRSTCFRSA